MPIQHPLQSLLEPEITKLGYELVRILTIGQKNPTLQIMIDRLDESNITVDDCAKVSRKVSEILDVLVEVGAIKGETNFASNGTERFKVSYIT